MTREPDICWFDEAGELDPAQDEQGRALVQAILDRQQGKARVSFSTGAGSPRIPSASVARVDQGNGPGENARDLPLALSAYVQMDRELVDLPPLEPWATLWGQAYAEWVERMNAPRRAGKRAETLARLRAASPSWRTTEQKLRELVASWGIQ